MKPIFKSLFVAAALAVATAPALIAPASAQLVVDVNKGTVEPLPIAITDFLSGDELGREIAGIVARVLHRGGFSGLPTGSHVFRHSLASAWLRDGSDLDHIGVALRHASRDTTAIYAKIDVAMLQDVAQPWPGASSC